MSKIIYWYPTPVGEIINQCEMSSYPGIGWTNKRRRFMVVAQDKSQTIVRARRTMVMHVIVRYYWFMAPYRWLIMKLG